MENLHELLKNKRKNLNLSLRNAAELIGISHSYLSTLEKGIDPRNNTKVRPTPETLKLISSAYGISYEYLMQITGYIINKDLENDDTLSEKDKKDIEKTLEKLKKDLMESEGLMLSGDPLSEEAMESIFDALSYGIIQAKKINKKFIPKKYRKE